MIKFSLLGNEEKMIEYFAHNTPTEHLKTKEEFYLEEYRHEVSLQKFSMLQTQSDKS